MKKNLTFLTGIVFLITILVAGGCNQGTKQNGSTDKEDVMPTFNNDSTVEVYLKATEHNDGRKHLQMYNGKDSLNPVIDSLTTVAPPGFTVVWKKAHQSGIKKVDNIRPIEDDGKIFRNGVNEIGVMSLHSLKIPINADSGTVKYEIVFTDKDDETWCIDPYLKIPDQ